MEVLAEQVAEMSDRIVSSIDELVTALSRIERAMDRPPLVVVLPAHTVSPEATTAFIEQIQDAVDMRFKERRSRG